MEFTMCQNRPGMCAGDPACSDRSCPGHPCNRRSAEPERMPWDEAPLDWRPVAYVAIFVGLAVAMAVAQVYFA